MATTPRSSRYDLSEKDSHICFGFSGPKKCDGKCMSTGRKSKRKRVESVVQSPASEHVCFGFDGPKRCDGLCMSTKAADRSQNPLTSEPVLVAEAHVCMGFNGPVTCDGNCASTSKKSKNLQTVQTSIPFPSLALQSERAVVYAELRQEVINTCLAMNRMGINQGTSGNVSVRLNNKLFAVTPSGIPYEKLTPSMIVIMDINDTPSYFGDLLPSSEWRIHYDIYRNFQDAKAIVHAHSTYSTALSCCEEVTELPSFHYMVAAAGGKSISKSKYATFGSQELSDNVCSALKNPNRKACLMSNHGLVAYGPNLDKALWLANEVECLSKQYVQILSTGLTADILSSSEMSTILSKFKTYGKNGSSRGTKENGAVVAPQQRSIKSLAKSPLPLNGTKKLQNGSQKKKPTRPKRKRGGKKKRTSGKHIN
mmetsp:Transcript_17428/g.22789  ORF Transcript_17428/g.22789 Transcript_17428/m.22789 type:complete len:424 (+) Transcript_17428:210-1481(+)